MLFQAFAPDRALQSYIETYWSITGYWAIKDTVKILPDGCVDLVFNLGEEIGSNHGCSKIRNETPYLIGPTAGWAENYFYGQVALWGIRFKPGGFSAFFQYDPLRQLTDEVLEFERTLFPDIKKTIQDFVPYLNRFFLDRLSPPKNLLNPLIVDIYKNHGQVRLDTLAKKHFITPRQLERHFDRYVGLTPKAFADLVRFRHTLQKIGQSGSVKKWTDIAFECGYYDQAHLINDFKRYTGTTPANLILSDFSNAGTV
jgi:AraC-like DNA-binding protein